MTHNQINYWNLKENERHNAEQEAIGKESNRISEIQAQASTLGAQASMLGSQARMIDAETNRYLAPSKEFANFSQSLDKAAVAGAITGIKYLGEHGTENVVDPNDWVNPYAFGPHSAFS